MKQKQCKICGEKFTLSISTQQVCSPGCAIQLSAKKNAAKAKQQRKADRMTNIGKKKNSPNSKYYRAKADKIFMSQFHGMACEVCGTTKGTCFHHIVAKSRSKALRYDRRNGIIVCPKHHTMGNTMAPHSVNSLAVERFLNWFKENHPERYAWIVENENITRRYTYKDAGERMKTGLLAWE